MATSPEMPHARANYGVDAPGVVRNLVVAAAVGLLLWTLTFTGIWSGVLVLGPVALSFGPMCLITGVLCTGMAAWMLFESRVGKLRERERLLDLLPWTGHEHVLDVGCGRGLMLIGAAKRLTTGKATGIDLWHSSDLSGNRPEAALENARREGVVERVEVVTADMRSLPFPDASFDVVLSSNAIHNLEDAADRDTAIAQIARVLKPGGRVLIVDIRHPNQYESGLRAGGCMEVSRRGSALLALGLGILTFGSLRPTTLLCRK